MICERKKKNYNNSEALECRLEHAAAAGACSDDSQRFTPPLQTSNFDFFS